MANANSADYYRRREQHARSLADAAVNSAIAHIHLEMAARYGELAGGATPVLMIASQRMATV